MLGQTPPVDSESAARSSEQPLVVLVVEDEPANRTLMQTVVEDVLGGRAVLASNGEEALAAATHAAPDVVLLDLMLPGMDWFAVAERLKDAPSTAHLPIVAVSALARLEDEQAARRAGCDAFVLKPFELADIERAIRTLVPRPGGQAGSPGEPPPR